MGTLDRALLDNINAELLRLDDTEDVKAYHDDDLPDGWVRVSDSQASCYGPAAWVLEDLRAAEWLEGRDADGIPLGWQSAWAALTEYPSVKWVATEFFEAGQLAALKTDTALALARRIIGEREMALCPILADALQDAGYADEDWLRSLRGTGNRDKDECLWLTAWLLSEPSN